MCPEELNIRQDEDYEDYESDEEKKETPCKDHATIAPNFNDMKNFKGFELKSNCTSFKVSAEGH